MKPYFPGFLACFLFPALAFGEVVMGTISDAPPEMIEAFEKERQAFLNLDPYEHEAVALDTNALYSDRIDSIEMLTNNPVAHLGALRTLAGDPDFMLRLTAVEIIDLVEPDFAWEAAKQLLSEASQLSTNRMGCSRVLNTAEFLAKKGDGSGFPLLVDYLLNSSKYGEVSSAISDLSAFKYLKELEPYKPLVAFVDQTLPKLASGNREIQKDSQTLLKRAIFKLAGLHAVETIPDFHRWLADPRMEPIRDDLIFNLKILNKIQAKLDAGEPDERDDPEYQRTPATDSAWKPEPAIRY